MQVIYVLFLFLYFNFFRAKTFKTKNIMELSKKYDEFLYEKTQSKLFISISSKMYGLNVKYINTEKKVLAYKKSYKDSLELEKRCKELRLESDILNDKLMLIFSEAKDEFLNSIKK